MTVKIEQYLSEKGNHIVFPKMGILAQSAQAKGKKINATIGMAYDDQGKIMFLENVYGDLKFDPAEVFPYAPTYGLADLRTVWQERLIKNNDLNKEHISLPIVTSGISHALNLVGFLFVNPKDKIIMSDKFWSNYKMLLGNYHNGEIVTYNTFTDNGYDLDSLFKVVDEQESKRKILLLNFPHNPSGYMISKQEVEKLVEMIKSRTAQGDYFTIICDDSYTSLIFEQESYQKSIFSALYELENVLAIKLDGVSKEMLSWGLRVGFITYGSKDLSKEELFELEQKTDASIRGSISSCSRLSQKLILDALQTQETEEEINNKNEILKKRYQKVRESLKNEKYQQFFKALPCNAGYFISLELAQGLVAEQVRQKLLEKYDTGVIVLGDLIRISFASISESLMEELFENIYQACGELA